MPPTFAGRDDVLLLVQVVFVALDVAAAALEGGRGLEDVPERFGAGLAVGGEVVEGGDELVAFVGQAVGLVSLWDGLQVRLLPALALVGIQDLRGGVTAVSQVGFISDQLFRIH